MYQLRVTAPDGSARNEPFRGQRCSVGRDTSNDISLTGTAVSSRHCVFELSAAGVVLRELGSRNGTYVNNHRIADPVTVGPGDRVFIGSFLVEVVPAPATGGHPAAPAPSMTPSGPILRTPGPNREYRDLHGRYLRYAEEWDAKGRPPHLALNPEELGRAKRWMASCQPGMLPELTRLQREFIAASQAVVKKRSITKALGIVSTVVVVGALATTAIVLWPESSGDPTDTSEAGAETDASSTGEVEDGFAEDPNSEDETASPGTGNGSAEDNEEGDIDAEIKHVVIPFETLPDVARRYEVSVDDVAGWNFLNPDEPNLREGSVVKIVSPGRRPLPQQRLTYTLEAGDGSWSKLANRFGIPVTKLQAYNKGVSPKAGTEIAVWIDPKPYKPRLPRKPIPSFTVDKRAASIGKPNAGKLANGIQLPESPLYTRRSPNNMWGSSQTISNLQAAVAAFRQDVDYDGALILSDISKKPGGLLKPHKSHQAGRDIDIWLPTVKGVYKVKEVKNGATRPRRPLFLEVDWYATWGLVRALIKTGAVEYVFLDWRYQEFVYRAAVNMDATPEELDEWIQWPRPRVSTKGIFRHSQDHLSHIHVRFKCAPWENECQGKVAKP